MIIDGLEVVVSGTLRRIVQLRAEYYEYVTEPESFVQSLRRGKVPADIFTFLDRTADGSVRFSYPVILESISVLKISTFEDWWKKRLNDKTRNMIRKAQKGGVTVSVVPFDDSLVNGIVNIYNESPMRQGKPFAHYGKGFEDIKRDHISYADRSDFIGAFLGDEMIGFAKLVHGSGVSNLMQIVSMVQHRDKAPTNALIAKAVEICAGRQVPRLHYGLWSKRGLGDFKRHHRFERVEVPRYFMPLGARGALLLKLGLHRKTAEYLPDRVVDGLVDLRTRWNELRGPKPRKTARS
jgi:hypothetical protein